VEIRLKIKRDRKGRAGLGNPITSTNTGGKRNVRSNGKLRREWEREPKGARTVHQYAGRYSLTTSSEESGPPTVLEKRWQRWEECGPEYGEGPPNEGTPPLNWKGTKKEEPGKKKKGRKQKTVHIKEQTALSQQRKRDLFFDKMCLCYQNQGNKGAERPLEDFGRGKNQHSTKLKHRPANLSKKKQLAKNGKISKKKKAPKIQKTKRGGFCDSEE